LSFNHPVFYELPDPFDGRPTVQVVREPHGHLGKFFLQEDLTQPGDHGNRKLVPPGWVFQEDYGVFGFEVFLVFEVAFKPKIFFRPGGWRRRGAAFFLAALRKIFTLVT